MTHTASQSRSPESIQPLLRSVQKEITERTERMRALEERLEAFRSTSRAHADEIARLQSELATHRRELRRIEKELERLGVNFDAENPQPIVSTPGVRAAGARSLEDTGFRPRYVDSRA